MSHRLLCTCAALVSACWLGIGSAYAESRIALVIGNSAYRNVEALPNPANDARAMTDPRPLDSRWSRRPTSTQADMRQVISDFAAEVGKPDTVVLVFYAGHGVQVDGENFPVDIQVALESDVALQAMRLSDLMNTLCQAAHRHTAPPHNPFPTINKTNGRGPGIVDAPAGSIVSYSIQAPSLRTVPGSRQPLHDRPAHRRHEPGSPIEQAFKRVRLPVISRPMAVRRRGKAPRRAAISSSSPAAPANAIAGHRRVCRRSKHGAS